jgi:hypothetical protein
MRIYRGRTELDWWRVYPTGSRVKHYFIDRYSLEWTPDELSVTDELRHSCILELALAGLPPPTECALKAL